VKLRGSAVLVTGGAGGIGTALRDAFRSAGASVTTLDLPGLGADLEADVTDSAAMRAAIDSLEALDVIIANAGLGIAGLAVDVDPADWRRSIDVNIWGTVNTVVTALPRLRAQGHGVVVLMSSLSGVVPTPLLTPYSLAKHAIVGLGESLRPELAADGIGVTLVCPGPVETGMLDAPAATPGVDVRRYLTDAGGPPLSPPALGALVVDAVRRDMPGVMPGRAGRLAKLQRHAPGATARHLARNLGAELQRARVKAAR
jgi:NAD(P)-dependent dehydrogenase (short-subunit alcohol dehydrogenase family)